MIATVRMGSVQVMIIGGGVHLAYSLDGLTWTVCTTPVQARWRTVSVVDRKFVAASPQATVTSPDGRTWTRGN